MNHNYGKMTMQEKKMNKNDLRAFRNYDNAMFSMVPGINNFSTVGAAAQTRKGAGYTLGPLAPEPPASAQVTQPEMGASMQRKSISMSELPVFQAPPENPSKTALIERRNPHIGASVQDLRAVYNPITNPLPMGGLSSNRYVARDRNKLYKEFNEHATSNVLQAAAQQRLMK